MTSPVRRITILIILTVFTAGLIYLLNTEVTWVQQLAGRQVPALGNWLDPWTGFPASGRVLSVQSEDSLFINDLSEPVQIIRDERHVPHIFAATDRDAVIALGYAIAQDRLFQMDFLPRVPAGRLSEILGPDLLDADRFFRSTGMEWAARNNWERIRDKQGIQYNLLTWFAAGVNAYIETLDEADYPIEFKILGYEPERYTPMHALRLLQYMNYDLSYRDERSYATLKSSMDQSEYDKLFPRYSQLYQPIIPGSDRNNLPEAVQPVLPSSRLVSNQPPDHMPAAGALLENRAALRAEWAGTLFEGYQPGKGSNNWAVHDGRSATGAPILANDMHLSLNLPAIWYEVQLVTPEMNVYGVTLPGSPLPVAAFNDHLGWGFTNVGGDVIDHYAMTLDESKTHYRHDGQWKALDLVPDTILIKGEDPVVDTLRYAHWGPVWTDSTGAVAIQWTAHKESRNLEALWHMNHARNMDEFQSALQYWDTAPQNILYADVEGHIAIRSSGHFPIRNGGHGVGLLDGTTNASAWVGRIPFDELPYAVDPRQEYLTSTNQQPVGPRYPYYLGHDWGSSYRSIRINNLLLAKERHTVDDIKSYQRDVHAVQRDLYVALLDTLTGVSERGDQLRDMLVAWDGNTTMDRPEPIILKLFQDRLEDLAWDEFEASDRRRPRDPQLYTLLTREPNSYWLDIQSTELRRETTASLLRLALDAAADTLSARYGWEPNRWHWGDHHKVMFRHMTQNGALRSLWRGPFPYPGYESTLSPAGGMTTTHSASWRVVMDFSQSPPVGYGVYPGGQSGNPVSPFYDLHIETYLNFDYFSLHKPDSPGALPGESIQQSLWLKPSSSGSVQPVDTSVEPVPADSSAQ